MSATPPLQLEFFQSLWAMQLRRPDGIEDSEEAVFEKVAGAGYDGVCIDLSVTDMATARRLKPLIDRHKLGCTLTAFPARFGDFPEILRLAGELEVRYLDIICQIMPIDVPSAAPVLFRLMEMAEAAGIEMHLETHRNSI
ncbi:MAG TPA: sugar phosphate isomerase/epimerase, partial [Alphaproteobacteria bacterium]|nr:sugar phosphate isomerase/epimerase [Alphaproteobacteria bacterium]